jgi:signal transduction histidine kinase
VIDASFIGVASCRRFLTAWTDRHPYVGSLGLIAAVTVLGFVSIPFSYLRASNIDTVYLLTVLISALRWGHKPSIFAALLSAIVFDFCFVPPEFTFGVSDLPYGINLFGYLAVAIAASTLAARSRALTIEQAARERAEAQIHAKDEILEHISHELRSPLNAVLGWAQLLDRPNMEAEQYSRGIRGLRESARLLGRLIDDLLSACRITSGKFALDLHPLDLAPIISAAVDTAALGAKAKEVRLVCAIEPVGAVLADELRIAQVVTNLLTNAIKFTPSGGQISVRLVRVGEQAELTVQDSGIGVAKAFLPHVFEPFSQADTPQARQGLGLGLSIVRHLVAAHGGDITVASPGLGLGTTFTVHLPAKTTAPPVIAQEVSSTHATGQPL